MAEDVEKPPIRGGIAEADEQAQGATARAGGQAKGGIQPQPSDPATPAQASDALEADSRRLRAEGFGDHKGGEY